MRVITILGIVLILAGAWVTINGGSFTTREEIIDIGDVEVTADRDRPIPTWVGLVAIVAGVAMAVSGARRRP